MSSIVQGIAPDSAQCTRNAGAFAGHCISIYPLSALYNTPVSPATATEHCLPGALPRPHPSPSSGLVETSEPDWIGQPRAAMIFRGRRVERLPFGIYLASLGCSSSTLLFSVRLLMLGLCLAVLLPCMLRETHAACHVAPRHHAIPHRLCVTLPSWHHLTCMP